MSGQRRAELLGSAIRSAPPTAGSLPLNFIENEYLQVNSPAAWKVNEGLQSTVRSVDVSAVWFPPTPFGYSSVGFSSWL